MRSWAAGWILTLAATASARGGESVTLKGSDTLIVLVQRWAELFMEAQPAIEIQVTGGGTGTGVAALLNGTTDLATASRAMTPEERQQLEARTGQPPMEWIVACDGATFYVNTQNPVNALTLPELRALYLGQLTRWEGVGGRLHRVSLYSRESSSGTYAFVKERLLGGQDFAVEAQTLPGTAAVVNAVAQEPWAIGYGGGAFARGVKELALRLPGGALVTPTEENVRSGRYPLRRDLYIYSRGSPSQAALQFVDFTLSPQGQRWARKLGYYPAR